MYKKNYKLNKQKISRYNGVFTMLAMTFFLICVSNSYAKYYKKMSIKAPIDWGNTDFEIGVLCADGEEILSKKLALYEINPGEKGKQILTFKVRNAKKDDEDNNKYIISDMDILYSIDVIHTENLPLEYRLYELTGVDEDGNQQYKKLDEETYVDKDPNNNTSNTGIKHIYSKAADDSDMELESKSIRNSTAIEDVTNDYYKLEIEWNTEDEGNHNNELREVDMVYLVIRASQEFDR